MNKQQMQAILVELKNELSQNKDLDVHERQRMEALAEEVTYQINQPEANMSSSDFLVSKLRDETEHFEVKHPDLTEIIARLADILARMGI